MRRACPCKNLWKQSKNQLALVRRLELSIRRAIVVVWLVPHIPGENALIVGERRDHPFDVSLEARILSGIRKHGLARRLHPTRVMHTWNGRALRAEFRIRV